MTSVAPSFEIKSQLAKLLATENITMQHNPNATTAYFDIMSRHLVLPVWQNISDDLYDMLVVHEVGHALDTPYMDWMDAIDIIAKQHFQNPSDRNKNAIKGFLNVIEDARIDKRQKRRYPGSRRNYVVGYKELYERDFFGIAKKDVNTLPFIDRINLYFKNGVFLNIKFSETEREFIKRIEKAETFADVVSLASEIFKYTIDNKDYKSSKNKQSPEAEDMMTIKDGHAMSFEEEDNEENEDEDFDLESDFTGSLLDEDADDADLDDEEQDAEDKSNFSADDINAPETEENALESLKKITSTGEYEYVYLDVPKFNVPDIVDDYKLVLKETREAYKYYMGSIYKNTHGIQSFHTFRQKESDTISFLVKEFEMKKSADTYSRTTIAKTGVLDMNKIHSYAYNEDIFRKMNVIPKGKNHGFVFFLDWSGSMRQDLQSTMKHLFSLILFCKRVQIPFEVYLFKSTQDTFANIVDPRNSSMHFDSFKLRNVLSSRMSLTELNEMMMMLWIKSNVCYDYHCDLMDSTPLNQTILVADELVNDFKRKNKLQVVNTIILTDGMSDPVRVNRAVAYKNIPNGYSSKKKVYIVRDPVTKKQYMTQTLYGHNMTEYFLKILKERTGSNLIGFFVSRSLKGVRDVLSIDEAAINNLKKSWNNNKYVGITSAGYDEYYCMNVRDLDISNDDDLKVNSSMTKKTVIKEFMKYSDKKTVNRVMLTKFIDRICKVA